MPNRTNIVTVAEAARILGVSPQTVRAWVHRGLLPAKIVRVASVSYRYVIKRSALKSGQRVTCRMCGKSFRSKRPRKAMFCCAAHRDRWHYLAKRR